MNDLILQLTTLEVNDHNGCLELVPVGMDYATLNVADTRQLRDTLNVWLLQQDQNGGVE